jgi:hypothetical protein
MRTRIAGGEFDIVLRLSPVNCVIPSPFHFFCGIFLHLS